jgi:uncharacterized membrane protein YphA (DoxX/SURF4 family)
MRFLTTTLARVLFALPFLVFGLIHLAAADKIAPAVPVPGGVFWVYFTGLAMIAGSIGIIFKILGKWAAFGIALLMAIFVVFVHVPGLANPQMRDMQLQGLLKDIALCGSALTWAGLLAAEEREKRATPRLRQARAGA